MTNRYTPCSTYRLQLNADFTFEKVAGILNYLEDLGISDIYSSPITRAKKGSTHGYDVAEPNQINPEIGTIEEFGKLAAELHSRKMGWIQDIVPNHMAYSNENNMLVDLFENGSNSRYYTFFDIEWNHPFSSVKQRVLTPILGKYYREVLENGELNLAYDQEGFSINYYHARFPLKMESYSELLSLRLNKIRNKLGKNHPDVIKYLGILYMLKSLPSAEDMDERYDQIKFVKGMLWELVESNEQIRVFLNETLKIYNGEKGIPDSYNLLDSLLAEQHFRLAFWKVATQEINYRRFFTVNELICLKMEREETFNRTHSLLFKLHKEKLINGFRIDHIDGLYDPAVYLQKLRDRAKNAYIIVEKILELKEYLPEEWPVEGTTGYEFTNFLNGIFCKTQNENQFNRIFSRFAGITQSYSELVAQNKKLFIQKRMAGEVEQLAFLIEAISSKDRYGIDITMHGIKEALEEILTYFPVYRSYTNSFYVADRDRLYIQEALELSRNSNPYLDTEFDYIENLLLLNLAEHFTVEQRQKALDFVMKFQQLTGPLMAKGFEDTTLYVYNRFISLNEVGGNPGKFGISLKEFHEFNRIRADRWNTAMSTSGTHDTKRGEDVRARLNVLSEIPAEWEERVKNWSKINSSFRHRGEGYPSRNDEYFLYQAMLGSYTDNDPEFLTRLKNYLVKSSREAKVHTSWLQPNSRYEEAYTKFAEDILSPQNKLFIDDFIRFQRKIAEYGIFNSLSQTLIKLTAPGIPDIYRGAELWDLSFVDPDNRRPVDFEIRNRLMEDIKVEKADGRSMLTEMLTNKENGKIKLFLIREALCLRKRLAKLFIEGEYLPIGVNGSRKEHIIAFARRSEEKWVITVVPRFLTSLIGEGQIPVGENVWGDTNIVLPENLQLENYFTNERLAADSNMFIKDILKIFPVALLQSGTGRN